MRVALSSLGCRLNEAELESWCSDFQRLGYSISSNTETADIVVVNTCAVTQEAVKKSRQLIRKSQRINPNAKLVVSGCYASLDPDVQHEIDGIDLLIPNTKKDKLAQIVDEQLISAAMPKLASEAGETPLFTRGRNRAFLKIQDGCRYRCTFCIVTVARGDERSKSIEHVVNEINILHQQQIKEVVLTGVHIGGYGSDINASLFGLIQTILAKTDIPRLRLGSVEPWDLGEEFIELFSNPRFMPHLHLPLQSGSDTVLRRMARRCMTDDYGQLLAHIRSSVTNFNVTTDIIVGFPGESEEEWQQSLAFIESCGFSHIHIFPYSQRQGTRAATLPEQVSSAEKKLRTQQLNSLTSNMRSKVMNDYSGFEFPVLIENTTTSTKNGEMEYLGYTPNYLKVKIISSSESSLKNQIHPVKLTTYDEQSMLMHAIAIEPTQQNRC